MKAIEKAMLKRRILKKIPYERYTKYDLIFLERQWIINWVWPENYWFFFRWVCTHLFYFLDYKRHDVNFWKGWSIDDFKNANWWLLKYSFISLADQYRQICNDRWYKKPYLIPLYYILLPFKVLAIHISYNACVRGGKKAFNFEK